MEEMAACPKCSRIYRADAHINPCYCGERLPEEGTDPKEPRYDN